MADRRPFSEIMNMNAEVDMDAEDEDEEKASMFKEPMRRNLMDVFDKTMAPAADERMCVYLRIRPFSPKETEDGEDQGCVQVLNEYLVSANAPKESHTYKSTTYGLGKAKHNFTFSRVFPQLTSQKEFFSATMLKLVQDFIEGQNCLVFTYGVTNSGKTYTIQGNPKDAGVLPRGLDVLFNSISGKQWPNMDLKPHMFNDVVKLTAEEEEKERRVKELVMKMNSSEDLNVMTLLGDDAADQSVMNATSLSTEIPSSGKACSTDSQEEILMEVQNRVREETVVDVADQGRIRFSVWVSFAEIYNEQIFDLLEPMPKKNNARRPVLKLSEDRRGSPYIKGLKEINVTSADEAYKLLTIGQRNLRTACTRLNHSSSRSHCIFNIKIIRVADKGNPKFARVSMLSLCDLAGSERQAKTQTTGERLKEAGNINTSLLTLGRCIELLRNNQHHKDNPKIIPFRDSRLTRLFQNFFCGRGKAAMIVNVSQCASMFDETLNVFKFSAIAKQVVLPKPEEKPAEVQANQKKTLKGIPARASSIGWDNSATPAARHVISKLSDVDQEEFDEVSANDEDYYTESLEAKICELEAKIKEMRKDRMAHEIRIRQEVCKEMQQQFVKIEDMYSTMLRETKQEEEERFEKRLKLLMDNMDQPSKRPRLEEHCGSGGSKAEISASVMVDEDDEWVSSLLLHQERVKVQERDASLAEAREEISKLRSEVTELQFQIADGVRKNKELADRVHKAEEAQQRAEEAHRRAEEDYYRKLEEIKESKAGASKSAAKCDDDIGHSVLLEMLGQQLQEAKDRLRHQEKEMKDLSEMLVDAGDTFHQKEEEISKLKAVIVEDEEKMTQQVETIRELRQLLEESRQTLQESEKKIEAKNCSIGNMKEELSQLQGRLAECHKTDSATEALRKCEEELAILKNCLKREEQDFQQREKALIHGYTAEINNLKSQMALLKSQNQSRSALSPVKMSTPDKLRSPSKRRWKVVGSEEELKERKKKDRLDESFRLDVARQLKDLQVELNQNRTMSAELRRKLQDARQCAEVMQQQLESKSDVERRLEQSQFDLLELQQKFEEMSSASNELQRQLESKKELQAELTDNQSESAELRQKLRIAESSAEDIESRLALATQQLLQAEVAKVELENQLKQVISKLNQSEKDKETSQTRFKDQRKTVKALNKEKARLEKENETYHVTLEAHNKKIEELAEERDQLKEKLGVLDQELKTKTEELDKELQKKEELEMTVSGLRAMVNQTTSDLEACSAEVKQLAGRAAKTNENTLLENQLQSALNEANFLLQQQSADNRSLQMQAESSEARVGQLTAKVTECELKEKESKIQIIESSELLTQKTQELQQVMAEMQTVKLQLEASVQKSQEQTKELEEAKQELLAKKSKVEDLEKDIDTLRMKHEQEVKDLKEQLSAWQLTAAEEAAAKNAEMQQKEKTYQELETKVLAKEEDLQKMGKVQKELEASQSVLKDKETVIEMLKLQLASAKASASEASEKLKSATEKISMISGHKEELEKRVVDLSSEIASLHQEKLKLQSSKASLEESLSELKLSSKKTGEELAGKTRILEDMKEKELVRCKKLTSLEEAQKKATAYHKKKMADLECALASKEKEVEVLHSYHAELQRQTSESNQQLSQLGEATVTIADLRSQLHMERAILQKYKDEVTALTEEKDAFQRQAESLAQEVERLQREKETFVEEASLLKERLNTAGDKVASLEKEIAELNAARQEQNQTEQTAGERVAALEDKVKELEESKENLKQSLEKVRQELALTQAQLVQAKDRQAEQEAYEPQSCTLESEVILQLKTELKAAHAKSEDLEKQMEALKGAYSAPDTPGSLRRLRKEKIRVESELATAHFKNDRLKEQLEKILNAKGMKDSSSFSSQPVSGVSAGVRPAGGLTEDEKEKLRVKLAEKEKLLQEAETAHQRCECELLEVRARLSNTMVELQEIKSGCCKGTPQSSLSEQETKQPLFRQADKNFLQSELKKSQEREASLRQELKQASITMVTNNATIASLEEQLAECSKKLEEVHRQLLDLQAECEASSREQQEVDSLKLCIKELEEEIAQKNKRLTAKQERVWDLQQTLAAMQAQKDLIAKDVKANEAAVQRLKDALVEQEETMAKQDSILADKENEIKIITTELTKITERHQQLVSQSGDSGRELRELTCAHARLQAEKEQCSKDLVAVKEDRVRLLQEISALKAEKDSTILKLKFAEDAKETISRDLGEAKREKDAAVARYKQALDECEALEKKVAGAVQEKGQLEEKLKAAAAECSRLTSTVTKEGKTTQNLEEQLANTQKELAKVKKAYEKDTQCLLACKAHEGELKAKVKTLQQEVKEMDEKTKKADEERQVWREQRDKLVGQMESILNNLSQENKELKAQQQTDQDHYKKLLEQEKTEKHELKRQLKTLQRAKDSVVADLRHTNHTLQGVAPPPQPPPPQLYSFRVNESDLVDDVDTTGHIEVDATPTLAAKSLRKSRKRLSSLNSSTSQNTSITGKTRRKAKAKEDSSMVIPETPETSEKIRPLSSIAEQERSVQSPVTRSVLSKKLLKKVNPDQCAPNNDNQENVSNSSSEESSRRGRRKTKKEDLPIACAPYQPPTMQTRQSRRLQGQQRQTSNQS